MAVQAFKDRILAQASASAPAALGRLDLAGTLKGAKGLDPQLLRKLPGFAVVYVLKGKGWYRDERLPRQRVQAGDLILVPPGLGHTYGPEAGTTWDEIYVCFSGPLFDLWRQAGYLAAAAPVVSLKPLAATYQRLLACVQVTGKSARERGLKQVCRLQAFLAEAFEGCARVQPAQGSWFEEACQALEHSDDLEGLAKDLGLSYESFRKKFKALAGLSPGDYREKRKLDQARALMGQYKLSNKQLAEMLGFYDEFHFSRRFKARFGASPRKLKVR